MRGFAILDLRFATGHHCGCFAQPEVLPLTVAASRQSAAVVCREECGALTRRRYKLCKPQTANPKSDEVRLPPTAEEPGVYSRRGAHTRAWNRGKHSSVQLRQCHPAPTIAFQGTAKTGDGVHKLSG